MNATDLANRRIADRITDMARCLRLEALLREAREAITIKRQSDVDLIQRIDNFLDGPLPGLEMPECVYCGGERHWSQDCPTVQTVAGTLS